MYFYDLRPLQSNLIHLLVIGTPDQRPQDLASGEEGITVFVKVFALQTNWRDCYVHGTDGEEGGSLINTRMAICYPLIDTYQVKQQLW